MQVVLHIGAHGTDEDRLIRCLLKNAEALGQERIGVPDPSRYRPLVRETLQLLLRGQASLDIDTIILDAVLDADDVARVIFSHEGFLGVPANVVGEGVIYPQADRRLPRVRELFGNGQVEMYLAMCDPATFIPAAFKRAKETSFETFMKGCDPLILRWSEMIGRVSASMPGVTLTVWANEDTPLIWPEILKRMAGHSANMSLEGTDDFLATLMTHGGLSRMQSYLASNPPKTEQQRHRVVAAFLDKFALEDVVETEIDLPGWSADYIEALTDMYDQDLEVVRRMDGINFIGP